MDVDVLRTDPATDQGHQVGRQTTADGQLDGAGRAVLRCAFGRADLASLLGVVVCIGTAARTTATRARVDRRRGRVDRATRGGCAHAQSLARESPVLDSRSAQDKYRFEARRT